MIMLDSRKAALRREIAAKEKELAKLDELPDLTSLADGSIVALFVTHHGRSKLYTYVAYLTGGAFYLTGATSPNGVSVTGLADWLTTGARRLVGVAPVAVLETGVVPAFDLGEASMSEFASARRRGSEWRDQAAETLNNYGYGD
jgi:hypothetical protein